MNLIITGITKTIKTVFFVSLTLTLSGNLFGKNYYVSTSGNNSNSGSSLTSAWKTLTYAAGSSSPILPGDTIYVQAGNYGAENVVFKKSGTTSKPIAFIGFKNKPGDAPPLLINDTDPYADYSTSNMPTFDGKDRSKGIAFNCRNQNNLIIKNFQIQNYGYGLICGSTTQKDDSRLVIYNVNTMTIGDISSSFAGYGIELGSMGTEFANNCTIESCLIVNVAAEGMDICGDNNILRSCKVYCNDEDSNAPTDYYILITGSYNKLYNCYVERLPNLSHKGHGISIKDNAEQVVDKDWDMPVINPQYNELYDCVSRNMGESFCVRHRGVQNNFFYHCKGYGTNTGTKGSSIGEGDCIVIRDGASNNTFEGCTAENCASGIVFQDTIEDGDYGSDPPGHPNNNNLIVNCLFINCYYGINYNDYSIQSDVGDNTVANCTFYKVKYMVNAERHCVNMKYVNNIYYGSLPNPIGGNFKTGSYKSDIVMTGKNTSFGNCNFYNLEGGNPSDFQTTNKLGNISKEPMFTDIAKQNFRLVANSPCVDVGRDINNINEDLDAEPRPSGNTFDIGAYEFQDPSSLSAKVTTSSVKCNGGGDGSVVVNATGGKQPYTYLWSNGNTASTVRALKAGTYSVIVSDADGVKRNYVINVKQPSPVSADFKITGPKSCSSKDGSVSAQGLGGSGNNYTYKWSTSPVLTTATATGLAVGQYSVTVTDNNGCSAIVEVKVTCFTGVDPIDEKDNFTAYPNPTRGILNIKSEVSENLITVFSLVGEVLYTGKSEGYETALDLSDFSRGIYFVRLENKYWISTVKIVVDK